MKYCCCDSYLKIRIQRLNIVIKIKNSLKIFYLELEFLEFQLKKRSVYDIQGALSS